jgi:4a-hydroxytetrahydrobiopterin dehydratase
VGHGDKVGSQAEREQHLGRRRDEADNPHKENDMAELLSDQEIESRLDGSDWTREDSEIIREWKFKDFAEAISFVNRVAEAAEEANHHPDILVHGWNKVRLSLTNHSAGGLTEPDFEMAGKFDAL